MYKLYIEVDTNDADYVGVIVDVDQEDLDIIQPLLEEMMKTGKGFRFCDYDARTAYDDYPDFQEAVELLYDLCPRGEHGFHSINEIQCMKVIEEKQLYPIWK